MSGTSEKSGGLGLRFWGCRGSIPRCAADQVDFGGNTICLEVLHGGRQALVVDAGSGVANLSDALARRDPACGALHLVFTHYHWDHICGLPYVGQLYGAGRVVELHGLDADSGALRETLSLSFDPLYSPIYTPENLACDLRLNEGVGGFTVDEVAVTPHSVEGVHPGGVWVLDLACGGKRVVIATDIEPRDEAARRRLVSLFSGADMVVADCQYSDGDYAARAGWGHSTWSMSARLAQEAGVGCFVGFHHDPFRSDAAIESMAAEARGAFGGLRIEAAREGMELWC